MKEEYKNVIVYSKVIMKDFIKDEMIVVDMTVGNGYDSYDILNLIGKEGFLYGFDIQKEAIEKANEKLKALKCKNYKLILDSHYNIDKYILKPIDFAVYNLGYLPGANKKITTKANVTLESLKKLQNMLNIRGMIHIVFYPGHEEGKRELEVIREYVKKLDQIKYSVSEIKMINQKNMPPLMICIQKRK